MGNILTFLGCGAAFNPLLGNTSAYMEHGSDLYILDCGESVFLKLYQKGMLTRYETIYIAITHLHADHVGSLGSLISYLYFVQHRKVHLIHPAYTLVELLDCEGIAREAYEMHLCKEFVQGDIRLEAVVTKHAQDMKCYGYLISDAHRTVYYSGDSYEISPRILEAFLDGHISVLYQDTASHVTDHKSHLPLSELARLIPAEQRSRVVCMHLDGDAEPELTALGFRSASRYV